MSYAFLDLSSQFQFEVVNQFVQNIHCKISYINIATEAHMHGDKGKCKDLLESIIATNPDLIKKDITDFLFFENFLKNENEVPWVISSEEIMNLKHVESMAMRLMDRNSLVNFSAFSRKRYYLILLNYFSYIIEKDNITDVVAFDTPHSFYSHIFFELCKFKKLNCIVLEYHYLTGYSVMMNDYNFPSIPLNFLLDSSLKELQSKLPQEIKDKIFKVSPILLSYKGKETKAIIKKSSFSTIKLYLRYIDKAIKNLIMGTFPFLFKKEVLHFVSLNNIKNRFLYRNILNFKLFKLIKLNILYNKIASDNIDLEANYVFVALHMQPEKTSQPSGLDFDNQYMMIKIISESVPNGWKVYVKEHPNQFNVKKVPAIHYRDNDFYNSLNRIRNIEFVPLEIDSIDLVAKSTMVATLTGTVGWEAITQFKPVLVFGHTYFMHCKCARVITSVQSCKKAINELIILSKEEMEKEIYRYLIYYNQNNYLVNAGRWEAQIKIHDLPYKDQISNLTNRMVYFHNKNNKQ